MRSFYSVVFAATEEYVGASELQGQGRCDLESLTRYDVIVTSYGTLTADYRKCPKVRCA